MVAVVVADTALCDCCIFFSLVQITHLEIYLHSWVEIKYSSIRSEGFSFWHDPNGRRKKD